MGTPTYVKPEFSELENCLEYARAFYQNAGGEGSENELSAIVGNKPTSSWFTLKLNAMRGYGLIDVDGDRLRITDLAVRILRPRDEAEEREALLSALRSFPIFSSLVGRYHGKGEPGPQFVANVLMTDGKASQPRASEWANVFLKAARHVRLFDLEKIRPPRVDDKEKPPIPPKPDESPLLTEKEINEGWLVYPVPVAKGVARIIVPRDLSRSAWEKMKKLLDAIEPEKTNGPEGPS